MYDDKYKPIGIQMAKKKKKDEENFLFVVLVMKQVDPSTIHYAYNGCNINIDISFFLFFSPLFALISMCMRIDPHIYIQHTLS